MLWKHFTTQFSSFTTTSRPLHDDFTSVTMYPQFSRAVHDQVPAFTTSSHEVHDRFATNALHSRPVPSVHDPSTASFWRVCVVLAFMALSAQLMHRGSRSPLAPHTPTMFDPGRPLQATRPTDLSPVCHPFAADHKKVVLGTKPILLSPFLSGGQRHVFAASDRPTIIYRCGGVSTEGLHAYIHMHVHQSLVWVWGRAGALPAHANSKCIIRARLVPAGKPQLGKTDCIRGDEEPSAKTVVKQFA